MGLNTNLPLITDIHYYQILVCIYPKLHIHFVHLDVYGRTKSVSLYNILATIVSFPTASSKKSTPKYCLSTPFFLTTFLI